LNYNFRNATKKSGICIRGPSWTWSFGSWIYNYLCNQYLSPIPLWVRISLRRYNVIKFASDLWQIRFLSLAVLGFILNKLPFKWYEVPAMLFEKVSRSRLFCKRSWSWTCLCWGRLAGGIPTASCWIVASSFWHHSMTRHIDGWACPYAETSLLARRPLLSTCVELGGTSDSITNISA
jgi:hypothetical protein